MADIWLLHICTASILPCYERTQCCFVKCRAAQLFYIYLCLLFFVLLYSMLIFHREKFCWNQKLKREYRSFYYACPDKYIYITVLSESILAPARGVHKPEVSCFKRTLQSVMYVVFSWRFFANGCKAVARTCGRWLHTSLALSCSFSLKQNSSFASERKSVICFNTCALTRLLNVASWWMQRAV